MSDLFALSAVPAAIRAFEAPLVTARLVLRLAEPADAQAFHRQFADWEVVRWLARPAWPVELATIRDFVAATSA